MQSLVSPSAANRSIFQENMGKKKRCEKRDFAQSLWKTTASEIIINNEPDQYSPSVFNLIYPAMLVKSFRGSVHMCVFSQSRVVTADGPCEQ